MFAKRHECHRFTMNCKTKLAIYSNKTSVFFYVFALAVFTFTIHVFRLLHMTVTWCLLNCITWPHCRQMDSQNQRCIFPHIIFCFFGPNAMHFSDNPVLLCYICAIDVDMGPTIALRLCCKIEKLTLLLKID